MLSENWSAQAACAEQKPDELFVQGAAQREARAVCFSCPVRKECLADALDNRVRYGVWGGMTERDRRAILRKRPFEESWAAIIGELDDPDEVFDLVGLRRPATRPVSTRSRSMKAG